MTNMYPITLSQIAKTTASKAGRQAMKTFLISTLAFGLIVAPVRAEVAATTVVQASGKTNAYISANGVPVVNIETANSRGLSHNKLTTYNVETKGLVINNGNNTQVSRQSTLAGQVISNLNLVQEAKVILMEVVSTNRSTLAGFQEVLGGKADVIVANPNGITCNGCGFLNTDRVTMTTGTSNIAGDGSLSGFAVNRGDILINGLGANGSTQQIFDLVARSIKVDGNINVPVASTLGLAVGTNVWDYTSRNVIGSTTSTGAAPVYAFDSTALGGMYAGRIRIVATEAGVGVRMLGQAAASADDFILTSAGKLEIKSAISAARDVALTVTSATGSEDLFLNGTDAKVSANRNTSITVAGGQTKLTEAELYAANNLTIAGGTLSDTSTAAKTRYAGVNNTTTMTGAASIDGGVWGAGGALAGSYDSLSIGTANSAKIYAGTTLDLTTINNMALTTAAVRAASNMSLTATAGGISTVNGTTQGVQTTAGNLTITAGNGLTNAGTITSDAGSVTARVSGAITNTVTGAIHSNTSMDIADKNGSTTESIDNSGTVIADTTLSIKAANITNQTTGTVQGTTTTAVVATNLTNAGTFIASSTAGQSGTLTLTNLSNSGTLQSAQNLIIGATDALANSGTVLASNNLSINAGASALSITNTSLGVMQATNALAVTGSNATFNTQSGKVLGNTVAATVASLNNSGTVQSETTTNLTVGNGITNAGTLLAKTTLTSSSVNLTNSGTLQANAGSTINVTNALANTGTVMASNTAANSGTLTVGTLSNTGAGIIQSAKDLTINATGNAFTNSNKIIANNDLTIASTGSGLTLNNNSGGFIQAGTASGDTLTVGGTAVTLNNNTGGTMLSDQLLLTATSAANAGTLQGGAAASSLTTTGALTNSGTLTMANAAAGSGAITAGSLDNSGILQSSGTLGLTVANGLVNAGTLLSGKSLTSSSVNLTNSGTLQANAGSTINVTNALANTGTVMASNTAANSGTLTVGTLSNTGAGIIQSAKDLTINATGNAFTNSNKIIANNDLTIASTGSGLTLNNNSGGFIQAGTASGDTLTVGGTAVTLNNNTGGTMLSDQLLLTATSAANAGTLQGGAAASSLTTTGALTNSGTLTMAITSAGSGSITANRLVNSGTLQSGGALIATVTNDINNSGRLLSVKALTASSATLDNSGTLQSNQGSSITVSGALTNSGTLLASNSASDAGTISAATITNSGTLESKQHLRLNVSGGTLTNSRNIMANNSLAITNTGGSLALNNHLGGYIQAGAALGDVLTIGGTALTLNNNAGASFIGNQLAITADSLTNAGTVQGGSGASTMTVSGAVNNTNQMNLATVATGSGTITADSITNSGTLQSNGSTVLNVATTLTNSNNLLTDGFLTVRGTSGSISVNNTGRMQSGGLMDIKGQSAGNGVNVTVGSSAVVLGDSVDINAGTVTVANGGVVSSDGNMTINANTLSFGGTTSRIVAANSGTGNANITLSSDFSNNGAVHSSGDMTFKAPHLTNTSTGGFSALKDLTVKATAGSLTNTGALYAGNQLNVQATSNITNTYGTGTMDSDGSITVTAGATFKNNSTMNALKDINITAATFRNEILGGVPSRNWTSINWGSDYETSSSGSWGWPNDATYYYQKDGSRQQYFTSSIPSVKPQIIAGRNMTIAGFSSAYNTGSVISASSGTLTISGSGTFTNDDLSLQKQNYSATWNRYEDCGVFSCDDPYTRSYEEHVTSTETTRSYGAGIFANTLNASGFGLVNQSSAWAASVTKKTATGAASSALAAAATGASGGTAASLAGSASGTTKSAGASLASSVSGTTGGAAVSGTTAANGKPAISFGGLVITLPTNPNGYFVTTANPASKYLVETNPLFKVGSNYVGSDYMQNRYGYNPDNKVKLLGDANYEAYLIKQELIALTGRNLLLGYANEKQQMQAFMDNALAEGKRQGFIYGQALSEAQTANLKDDIVWMVETTVGGQRVLAPVVYLATQTKEAIQTGAVIAGNNVDLNLTSLTNTGGTIQGKETLNIASKGDITNTSGSITGGNVSLKSITGSIKNETLTSGSGNSETFATSIGKTAGITATGNLVLDAKKDIAVTGANVSAGGNASLAAGGNVTFNTIVDKTTTTTRESSDLLFNSSSTTTTTTTERNIGSNLGVGGNLTIKSGGDTTLAGTQTKVGGDLDVNTGGSFKVVSVQDKTTTKTVSETSGFGVGGGLAGSEKKTTDDFKGTNVASSLAIGGNATIKSAGSMTVQGSNVDVKGNAAIDAKSINVLDGLDERRTKTVTETTTFLSTGSEKDSKASSGAESKSSGKSASSSAEAKASAAASASSELNFSSTTTKTQNDYKGTSIASTLNVGGNLSLTAQDKITVQGSDVKAGGDLSLAATNVDVLAGRNIETSTIDISTVKTGIYTDSKAEANAESSASATGMTPNAKAGAEAKANADSTVTIGVRVETSRDTRLSVTNRGSTLTSGGNTTIKAAEAAKFVGATVDAGGDLSIKAKDITNLAAQDINVTTSTSSKTTTGVYLSGEASAETTAKAKAGAGGMGASAKGTAEVKAEASVGLRAANETKGSEDGSVTNVVSSFKSGGNITRTASNAIVDQGTQLDAGGNINQTAKTLTEIAATNKAWKSETATSVDARIGVYADANAEATAGGGAGVGGKSGGANAEADASAGVKVKVTASQEASQEEASQAVTSRYRSGGSINSATTEKTTLIGTQFESGKDINISAKSLDFQAARDTTSQSSSGQEGELMVKGGVAVSGGKVEAEGSYAQSGASASSSTARAGGLSAGGNLTIKTQDDLRLEGANVAAGGAVDLASTQGSVILESAKSTTTAQNSGFNVAANIKVSGEGAEGGASGGYNQGSSASTTNNAVVIQSGTTTNIAAAKDVTLEGTKVNSGGATSLAAGGTIKMVEVRDTEKSSQLAVQANVQLSKESQSGGVSVAAEGVNKGTSTGVQINSGGALNIAAKTVVNQQADLKAAGPTTVVGKVETLQKTADVDTAYKVEVGIDAVNKSPKKEDAPQAAPAPKAKSASKSKTTDDVSTGKQKASAPASKNKTTDDTPAKSATDTKSKAETIEDLKNSKSKLDAALPKPIPKKPQADEVVNAPITSSETKQVKVVQEKAPPTYLKPTFKSIQRMVDPVAKEKAMKVWEADQADKKRRNSGQQMSTTKSRELSSNKQPAGREQTTPSPAGLGIALGADATKATQQQPAAEPTKADTKAGQALRSASSDQSKADPKVGEGLAEAAKTKAERAKTTTELKADKAKFDAAAKAKADAVANAKKEKESKFFTEKDKIFDKSVGTGEVKEFAKDAGAAPRELKEMEVKVPSATQP